MWNKIWNIYVKDWTDHKLEDFYIQVISIVFILVLGLIAIRILGNKSISQMSLINVLFIFVLSSTLGALITKPHRIFVALLVVITIVIFIFILEKIPMKFNRLEKALISSPVILYDNGNFNEHNLRRNNLSIDMVESHIRQHGYPSFEVCKTIILEPTGIISFELKPEYEPLKKIFFDYAMQQLMDAINDSKYMEIKMPKMNNAFEETKQGKDAHKNNPVPKHLE